MPSPERSAPPRAALGRIGLACLAAAPSALLWGAATSARADTSPDASTASEIAALRRELHDQQQLTRKLARRLDALAAQQVDERRHHADRSRLADRRSLDARTVAQAGASGSGTQSASLPSGQPGPQQKFAGAQPTVPQPGIKAAFKLGDSPRGISGYKSGFYIGNADGDDSLYINALLQPRYTYFDPTDTRKLGTKDKSSSNFDVYLARLYFSGSIIDPTLTYFFTLQASTEGNPTAPGIVLLDGEIAKTFSPALKIEAGRYWSAYTYEYFDDIGKYLLPDLSAAEWAFALGRQVGVRASGQVGDLTYRVSVSDPIPGSLSGGTLNTTTKVALIGNVTWDILAPYGYVETDPSRDAAPAPELSLWASGMYNPVQNASRVYNEVVGDDTDGATASLNFRYRRLTFQGSGYYEHNDARGPNAYNAGHPGFDSFGWQEQAGFYLLPSRLEVAERVDGVHWGYRQNGPVVPDPTADTQWFSGPNNFGWRNITEYNAGLNYYLHGHNAKAQLEYSYLLGSTFADRVFNAERLILQGQLAF